MENYILKVILFQLLFLLVYEILLKKETFFNYNRWYLLLAAVVSFFLPLIKIDAFAFLAPAQSLSGITNVWLPEVFIGAKPEVIEQPTAILTQEYFIIDWWLLVYGVGLLGSLMILFRKYQNLERLFKFRKISAERDFQIIEIPNSSIACTFYKTIFLGDKLSEAERQHILIHELVHVKQKHSLDLVFFEILKIIFWFNPLIYIFQYKITTLHEFIADANAVKTTEKANYYEQLLNTAFSTKNISFINQFFKHSLIKKRIVMLQRSRSKTTAKLKYLFIVPLMLTMFIISSCSQDLPNEMDTKNSISKQLTEIKKALDKGRELTETERNQFYSIMEQVVKDKNFPPPPPPSSSDENKFDINEVTEKRYAEGADVPFAVVQDPPLFIECDDLVSSEVRKKCTSSTIKNIVDENFDISLAEKLGSTGTNRIIVVFKINREGKVSDIRARAPHPDLEIEAIRVISLIPPMKPAMHNGTTVSVSYSLPIVFQVNE